MIERPRAWWPPCPRCGADTGEYCRQPAGRRSRRPHAERRPGIRLDALGLNFHNLSLLVQADLAVWERDDSETEIEERVASIASSAWGAGSAHMMDLLLWSPHWWAYGYAYADDHEVIRRAMEPGYKERSLCLVSFDRILKAHYVKDRIYELADQPAMLTVMLPGYQGPQAPPKPVSRPLPAAYLRSLKWAVEEAAAELAHRRMPK